MILFVFLQTFAIRFSTPEIAQEFKAAFTSGQADNKKLMEGGDSTEGKKEAEEATEALAGLEVKEKEEPKADA